MLVCTRKSKGDTWKLTISNLTLLTKGDVVRNLLTAVNIFPSNVAALPASCLCEHSGPMSACSPGLGNNSRQSFGPRFLFFSSFCESLCHRSSLAFLRRTLSNRAQHVSASEPASGWLGFFLRAFKASSRLLFALLFAVSESVLFGWRINVREFLK